MMKKQIIVSIPGDLWALFRVSANAQAGRVLSEEELENLYSALGRRYVLAFIPLSEEDGGKDYIEKLLAWWKDVPK